MSARSGRWRIELRRSRRAAVVVLAGLVLGVAAAVMLLARLNVALPGEDQMLVRVAVDDAGAVVPGRQEVRWAGVIVGRITDVELRDGRPILTAGIDPHAIAGGRPYRDATMRLRPQTALNDLYLDVVDRGSPAAGVLGEEDVLPAARTQTPVDVAEVLDIFSADHRENLRTLLGELSIGLGPGGGRQLRTAFAALVPALEAQGRLSRTLARRGRLVRSLVHDTRLLTGELARRDEGLTSLVRRTAGTFRPLAAHERRLDAVLAELPPTVEQLRGSMVQLRGTLTPVRSALHALRPAARALPGGLRALDGFARQAAPALTAVAPAVRALTPLARDLTPTARSLNGAFTQLAPQAPRLERVARNLERCELSTTKFFAWTLSVLKLGNAGNRTSSPRGILVASPGENGAAADPLLTAAPGCADGRPSPR